MSRFFIEGRGASGEYFQLHVLDINNEELLYMDPSGQVRALPIGKAFIFVPRPSSATAGETAEVFVKPDACWWPCQVLAVKGEFATVTLDHNGRQEVTERALVRRTGQSAALSGSKLHRYDLQLADDLQGQTVEEEMQRELGRRLTGPYLPIISAKKLSLLTLECEDVVKMRLIRDLFVRSIRWKLSMRRAIDDLQQRLAQLDTVGDHVVEEFPVPQHLIGLAIGSRGANIRQAQELPGVSSIEYLDESGVFRVYGVDAESCTKARMLLEFMEDVYMVPDSLVGRVIGRNGRTVQLIIDRALLISIRVGQAGSGDPISPGGETCTPFTFLGTREAIGDARFMMDFEIETARSLDELAKQAEMAEQLKENGRLPRFNDRRSRQANGH